MFSDQFVVRKPKVNCVNQGVVLNFRMVNLRPRNRTSGSENPDLRDMIASEVKETLQQMFPRMFSQMREKLGQMIDKKIEAAFTTRDQRAEGPGQGQNRGINDIA